MAPKKKSTSVSRAKSSTKPKTYSLCIVSNTETSATNSLVWGGLQLSREKKEGTGLFQVVQVSLSVIEEHQVSDRLLP